MKAPTGWDPMAAEWWPAIAQALPKPWPQESVWMDLRWWAARERVDGHARPGRPTLSARWGWTDWATKAALKDEGAWADPRILEIEQRIGEALVVASELVSASITITTAEDTRPPPADRQDSARTPPADRQDEDGSSDTIDRKPPAVRQQSASGPPAVRPRRVGSPYTDPSSTEEENEHTPPVPVGGVLPTPLPGWASKLRPPSGVSRRSVAETFVACVSAVKGRAVDPARCGTDAAQVDKLWRALGCPPVDVFAAEFSAVAEAAHRCPDRLFAHDIRGEGWAGAPDRSHDVTTIAVQARWSSRVDVATRWQRSLVANPKPSVQADPVDRRCDDVESAPAITTRPELLGAWTGLLDALSDDETAAAWLGPCALDAIDPYVLLRVPTASHVEMIEAFWRGQICDHFGGRRVVVVEDRRDAAHDNVVELRRHG